MQGVQPEDPTRFEVIANDAAVGKLTSIGFTMLEPTKSGSVARTPFGWFAISSMAETSSGLAININANQQVRPTANDVAIIARALQMLSNESVWNKEDNRQCPAGQAKISLFCALQLSTTAISGGIHYRQPALQAVREVLNTVDASRIKTHLIMDYNNHPATTLAKIHNVLKQAQVKVEKDMAKRN